MFNEVITRLAKAFDGAGIPYMLMGGQAILYYGEPRFTRDIDITLGLDIDGLELVISALREAGFVPAVKEPDSFVSQTMVLPAACEKTAIRIDIVFSNSVYEKTALARAVVIDIEGLGVKVIAVEDLLIHKIIASRPRDIEDVRGILARGTGYDRNYVLKWLAEFDSSLAADFSGAFISVETSLKQA